MSLIVPIIVVAIIVAQFYFFIKNVRRMREYKNIFSDEKSWKVAHDPETTFVCGIKGKGNNVFVSIKDSINKYLKNNSGSVIDFSLLKDAVDRHCDSVENDINTLTPVPLYCGLAGTMLGVILGLGSLLVTGSISSLLSSGSGNFDDAANGVNDLLAGVAWAMLASICGIVFTTAGSILFKKYKLEGESGKNTFLAWLQAKLLPELPSDTSDALNNLVRNLNKFNNTFAENTSQLRGALTQVNESYRIQGDIIKAVHDMDVMKMANANVKVMRELEQCTDKLEQFNQYLNDIHGYTDAIHTFTTKFEEESNRLHVLEEIRDYFNRHKAELTKDTANVNAALNQATRELKETASRNAVELRSTLVQQAEEFKNIIQEEKESFVAVNNEIKAQFSAQLSHIPMLERRLSDIAELAPKLDNLVQKLEQANNKMASSIDTSLKQLKKDLHNPDGPGGGPHPVFPNRVKWVLIILVGLIAIACISNTIHNIWCNPANHASDSSENEYSEIPTNEVPNFVSQPIGIKTDTTAIPNIQPQSIPQDDNLTSAPDSV